MSADFEDEENPFEDDDSGFDESSGSLDGQIAIYLTLIQEAQEKDQICFLLGQHTAQRINPTDREGYIRQMIDQMLETDEYINVTYEVTDPDIRVFRDDEPTGQKIKKIDWFRSSQRLRSIQCMQDLNRVLGEEEEIDPYLAAESVIKHYETYEWENIEKIRSLVLELLAMGHVNGYRMLADNFIATLQQTRKAVFDTVFDTECIESANRIAEQRKANKEFMELTYEQTSRLKTTAELFAVIHTIKDGNPNKQNDKRKAVLIAYLRSLDFEKTSGEVRSIVIDLTNYESIFVAKIARKMLQDNGYSVRNGQWQRKGVNH